MRTWLTIICLFIPIVSFSGCNARHSRPVPDEQAAASMAGAPGTGQAIGGQTRKYSEAAAALIDEAIAAGVTSDVATDRSRAVKAVAVVFELGFPEEEIVKLSRDAKEKKISLASFARTMEAMANLKGGGMPSDLAIRTARILILDRYSEKGIARVEWELFYWREKQYSWTDAFYRFHSGCRPGMGCFGEDGYMP